MSAEIEVLVGNKNKLKVIASAVTLALHGAVGVGLATMKMHDIPTPPKPAAIRVELVNLLESPTPQEEIAPEPQKTFAPKPTKKVESKPEPVKKIKPKPELIKKTEPVQQPEPIKKELPKKAPPKEELIQKEPVIDRVELQRQQMIATENARQAKLKAEAEAMRIKAEAEAAAKARAEAEARAKAEAKIRAEAEAASKARREAEARAKEAVANSQPLSITVTGASWRSKPNLHFDATEAAEFNPTTKTVSVSFSFDEKGKISNIQISSTGDSRLDREIKRRIARASLHPQKRDGVACSGNAKAALQINI